MPGWGWGEGSWQAELRGKRKGDKRRPWVDLRELSRSGRAVYSCAEAGVFPLRNSVPSLGLVLLCVCFLLCVSSWRPGACSVPQHLAYPHLGKFLLELTAVHSLQRMSLPEPVTAALNNFHL